jgi:hypothetical protein
MKCDTCQNQRHDPESAGSWDYCAIGNWYGLGNNSDIIDQTLWDDCEDYKPLEGKK